MLINQACFSIGKHWCSIMQLAPYFSTRLNHLILTASWLSWLPCKRLNITESLFFLCKYFWTFMMPLVRGVREIMCINISILLRLNYRFPSWFRWKALCRVDISITYLPRINSCEKSWASSSYILVLRLAMRCYSMLFQVWGEAVSN